MALCDWLTKSEDAVASVLISVKRRMRRAYPKAKTPARSLRHAAKSNYWTLPFFSPTLTAVEKHPQRHHPRLSSGTRILDALLHISLLWTPSNLSLRFASRQAFAKCLVFTWRFLSLFLTGLPHQKVEQQRRLLQLSVNMAARTAGGNAAFHNFNNDYAHIADPNERRRLALAEIDKAPFGWYHVRAILVAGIGFFTDAYDIFAIGIVTTMLGVVYWQDSSLAAAVRGTIPANSDTAIKVATSGGTVIGQLGFGWLADMVGRKKMYGLELILIIFSTVAQALSSDSPSMSIVGTIIFWRVLMGGKLII